jgi:hypothetical protein
VVGAETHAGIGPSVEEEAGVDGATGTLALTNGPELLEGLDAVDRRLVDTSALAKLVGGSSVGDSSFLSG